MKNKKIKQAVKKRYSRFAREGTSCCLFSDYLHHYLSLSRGRVSNSRLVSVNTLSFERSRSEGFGRYELLRAEKTVIYFLHRRFHKSINFSLMFCIGKRQIRYCQFVFLF